MAELNIRQPPFRGYFNNIADLNFLGHGLFVRAEATYNQLYLIVPVLGIAN
jgi:hypothetical protein